MAAFAKIAGQLAAGVKRDFLSMSKVRVILSWGFPYEAYSGNATVKPWHVLNLVESGRALTFNRMPNYMGDPFLNIEDLYAQHGIFQGSIQLKLSKELYDISLTKTPISLTKELVYAGKSSFNIHTDVLLPSSSLTLASCEVQSVLVDRFTRRPSPLPDWWVEKYGKLTLAGKQLKVLVKQPPVPENQGKAGDEGKGGLSHSQAFAQSGSLRQQEDVTLSDLSLRTKSVVLTVHDSETDGYGHVNWTVYLKYCLDALLMDASSEISKNFKRQAVKAVNMAFIQETSVGKKLKILFWKDEVEPDLIHFHILDKDSGQLINYVNVQFFPKGEIELSASKL